MFYLLLRYQNFTMKLQTFWAGAALTRWFPVGVLASSVWTWPLCLVSACCDVYSLLGVADIWHFYRVKNRPVCSTGVDVCSPSSVTHFTHSRCHQALLDSSHGRPQLGRRTQQKDRVWKVVRLDFSVLRLCLYSSPGVQGSAAQHGKSDTLSLVEKSMSAKAAGLNCNFTAKWNVPCSASCSSPTASCLVQKRSAWLWQRWPPCFQR